MWCARTSFFIDRRIWARVFKSKVISVITRVGRYRPPRRAFDRETGTLVWKRLAPECPQHVTFGGRQSGCYRPVRRQVRVETFHEKQRRTVVNLPKRGYHRSGTSQKECSGQVRDALLSLKRADGGIAGRKHYQI